MATTRLNIKILLLFVVLSIVLSYPQVTALTTSVPFHSDPFFSMWRLGWVARQLPVDPENLFDANIFFPEPATLAFSDAMIMPAVLLAPLFWLSLNPVTIYNLSLLAAMALSGFTAFLLAHRLSQSVAGGVVAGTIFAFAPYRFDHYVHFELQVVFWIPLALVLIHRLFDRYRLRDGVLLGATVAAQALSSMYIALFFVAYCAAFLPILTIAQSVQVKRLVAPLAIAAVVTLIVVVPYAAGYQRARTTVGTRSLQDVGHYGASMANYVAAPPMNRLYGRMTARLGADELYLFPGFTAIALAALGVFLARGPARLAYAGALILAFDMSRGLNGITYGFLFQHVLPFRALRSPARIGVLVNLSLAVLAAYGVGWLLPRVRQSWRQALAITLVAGLSLEYASAPVLARAPQPSQVDEWLARQEPVVILQLPMTRDWLYMYQGLGHRQRMLNGYSGYVPASYWTTVNAMRSFPDDHSVAHLRSRQVDYVILRGAWYSTTEWAKVNEMIRARQDLSYVATFSSGANGDAVYELTR